MTAGVSGFVPGRLRQAREARGLSLVALGDLVGVSAAAISYYEKGQHAPRWEVFHALAQKLNLPITFFQRAEAIPPVEQHRLFWRSMSSATKNARTRGGRRLEWFKEVAAYFEHYLDFPAPNVPDLGLAEDFRLLSPWAIESAAEQIRAHWRLGMEPIADVVRTMETNGIFVTRGTLDAEALDAFSEYDGERPYIFLGSDKKALARSRFDCAHELGHLILHRHVKKKDLSRAADFKLIESQAHHFAGAFLFPEQSFRREASPYNLDVFRSLKPRWKTSIAAMIARAGHLNLLTEEGAKRLWINRARRGWVKSEPLDDMPCEQPKMFGRAVDALIKARVRTPLQIIEDLALPANDVAELVGLDPEFFRDHGEEPTLKPQSNVVQFRRA